MRYDLSNCAPWLSLNDPQPVIIVATERCQSGRMGRSRKPLWSLSPPWVRIPPSPQVISSPKAAYAALTAGLNCTGGTTVKVQGICDRDRSVPAGRSRFLIAYQAGFRYWDPFGQYQVLCHRHNLVSMSRYPDITAMPDTFLCVNIYGIPRQSGCGSGVSGQAQPVRLCRG